MYLGHDTEKVPGINMFKDVRTEDNIGDIGFEGPRRILHIVYNVNTIQLPPIKSNPAILLARPTSDVQFNTFVCIEWPHYSTALPATRPKRPKCLKALPARL